MCKLGLEKAEEIEIKLPTSIGNSLVGRSAGEGIGYPLHYSWASLLAQLVKNLPVMQKTWVQVLGWKEPLEKGLATHSSILAWRILDSFGISGDILDSPWCHKESNTTEHFHFTFHYQK